MANDYFTPSAIIERLLRHVLPEPNSGCWLWVGSGNGGKYPDYGKIKMGGKRGKMRYAHVVSYELHIGTIPEGLELDHLCRVRCCVNPRHLEPVTPIVNCRRGNSGKAQAQRTHCPQGHPYSEENTLTVARPGGGFNRMCRECGRTRTRHWRASKG